MGSWAYYEHTDDILTTVLLTLFAAVNQSYFMGFFFLLAGYFTPGSYYKKGIFAFLKDRLLRLGIPLFLYTILVNPFITYTYLVNFKGMTLSLIDSLKKAFCI